MNDQSSSYMSLSQSAVALFTPEVNEQNFNRKYKFKEEIYVCNMAALFYHDMLKGKKCK